MKKKREKKKSFKKMNLKIFKIIKIFYKFVKNLLIKSYK